MIVQSTRTWARVDGKADEWKVGRQHVVDLHDRLTQAPASIDLQRGMKGTVKGTPRRRFPACTLFIALAWQDSCGQDIDYVRRHSRTCIHACCECHRRDAPSPTTVQLDGRRFDALDFRFLARVARAETVFSWRTMEQARAPRSMGSKATPTPTGGPSPKQFAVRTNDGDWI